MQLITSMNVGDVHLKNRSSERFQCVKHCNRSEGISRWIDDQCVGLSARRLYEIDQYAFVIRLMKR